MPTIIETTVFEFGELSDAAKERARLWYRERAGDWDWFDFIYDDFEAICTILGVELRTQAVRLMGGGTRQKPAFISRDSGRRATAPASKQTLLSGRMRHARCADMPPRMPSCTALPMFCSPSSGATSISSALLFVIAAGTITSIACRSMLNGIVRSART